MLVAGQLTLHVGRRSERVACGSDRLVRLLGVLHLALVPARRCRNGLRAVQLRGLGPSCRQRRLRQRRRVGAHVGDVPVLVQLLGDAHRRLGREAELPARFLLQRRGHERGGRAPGVRLLLHRPHGERGACEACGERSRCLFVERQEVRLELAVVTEVATLGNALLVDGDESCFEPTGVERAEDVPVGGCDEQHPLALPLDDEPGRDRLDAPRRKALHHLLPEDGRHLVAVEPVEDPARLLRVDEPLVDLARFAEGALDRLTRDLVEDHALDRHLRLQDLEQMPGDRLALAILVGCEQELARVLQLALQLVDLLLLVGIDQVERLERVVDVDAESGPRLLLDRGGNVCGAVGEVADVADRRLDHIAVAEIAGNGLCLGRRLDDNETAVGHELPFRVRRQDPPRPVGRVRATP